VFSGRELFNVCDHYIDRAFEIAQIQRQLSNLNKPSQPQQNIHHVKDLGNSTSRNVRNLRLIV
jgi:hypothetical protein